MSDEVSDEIDIQHNSRIAKLIDERDTLLQTGVYTLEDRLITELEKEIQHMIEVNGWDAISILRNLKF